LIQLGYKDMAEDEARLAKFVEEAKAIADQKKVVSDQDLETLLGVYMDQVCERERGGRGVV
jgi:hypothetical protein